MPLKQSTNGSNLGYAPVFAQSSARDVPLPYQQAISEVPKGILTTAVPPSVKLTRQSVNKLIRRNAIVATHWYNMPLVDGLRSVASIYKMMEQLAFNYQRTHQDAFFEAYPELLIRKESDEETTHYLRIHYRTFCKRIAHYWYEYGEAKKMQLAALLNLLTLTRLNGNELFKTIASDVRWSRINTACVLYERFPSPVGLESYALNNTRYATGKTTFGADIVSIGLWKNDILGNVLSKQIPLDNFVTSNDAGDATIHLGDLPDDAQQLLSTMQITLSQFVNGLAAEDGPFGPVYSSPEIENGSMITASGDDFAMSARLNAAVETNNERGMFNTESALTKRLWALWSMWNRYLTYAFPQMMDPNNDRYTFAVTQLHLFEPSSKLEDMLKNVRSNANFDITSLANAMTYKAVNRPNTATVVKFAPALYDTSAPEKGTAGTDALITLNFERYEVDSDNIATIIKSAKKWPHINPTMFTNPDVDDNNQDPLMLNAAQTVGVEITAEDVENRYIAPVGKFASLLDYAVSCSVAPELSRATGVGLDAATFQKFVESGNSIVYEECPDCSWVMTQPLIDSSDLGQCGFNILISADNPIPNEWEEYFENTHNYNDGAIAGDNVPIVTIGDWSGPLAPAIAGEEGAEALPRQHVSNKSYRDLKKHLLVFVGGGIFSHPWFSFAPKNAGYFAYQVRSSDADLAVEIADWFSPGDGDLPCMKGVAQWNLLAAEFTKDADDAINPIAGILSIIATEGSAENLKYFIFSPDYGPVAPCAQVPPTMDMSECIPAVANDLEPPKPGDSRAFVPKIGYLDISKGAFIGHAINAEAATRIINLYDPLITPALWLLYFLDSVEFPSVKVDQYGGVITEEKPITLSFSDITKWEFALTSRVVAQFSGMHDTRPFWDACDMQAEAHDISSSSQFPENNILAEPRRVQATGQNKARRYTGGKSGDRDQFRAATASSSFDGKSNGNDKRRKPNKWSRAKAQEADKVEVNSDSLVKSSENDALGKLLDADKADVNKVDDKKKLSQNNILGAI